MVTALAAIAAGCARIIVSDVDDAKLALAETLGPVMGVNIRSKKLVDVVQRESDGWSADVVFEASGNEKAAAEVFDLICPGGRVVFTGMPPAPIAYDVPKAQIKEARVEHVFRYAHVYGRYGGDAGLRQDRRDPADHPDLPLQATACRPSSSPSAPPAGSVKVQIELPA